MSLCALGVEVFGLRLAAGTGSGSIQTLVTGTTVMQVFITAACGMLGVLWSRALARVRAAVRDRAELMQQVNAALTALATSRPHKLARVLSSVTAFQRMFRFRQQRQLAARTEAMEAYVMAAPDRSYMLRLVYLLTAVYLISCVWTVLLFGTWRHLLLLPLL